MTSAEPCYQIIIIGGGLAGLSAALHLKKFDFDILLIDKNEYPRHKVCGEYISNEVLPYLNYLGIDVFALGAKTISRFEVSTAKHKPVSANLPLGGVGISRYALDNALYQKAKEQGIQVLQETVMDIQFLEDRFKIDTKMNGCFGCEVAIGAYGKRTNLDMKLNRKFIKRNSPYLAVKTHVTGDFPDDVVALHNFEGGYCGVSKVEDDSINLCYITDFKTFKKYGNIEEFQKKVVFKNRVLKSIFNNSSPVFETPLTISQISFDHKLPVEDHILMCGDSAGMIHPLCGNGMSMAIRSAQMAAGLIVKYLKNEIETRDQLECTYKSEWNTEFKHRLKVGHIVAKLFNNRRLSNLSFEIIKRAPFLMPFIIKQTHGKPMIVE